MRRQDWQTPPRLFAYLDREYGFDLDAAASPSNAKCACFFTEADNGLEQPWVGRVFCNPPFNAIDPWVRKAHAEVQAGHAEVVVMLLPGNRTDQGWWTEIVEPYATVRSIRGRVWYVNPDGSTGSPEFASVIVEFRPALRMASGDLA